MASPPIQSFVESSDNLDSDSQLVQQDISPTGWKLAFREGRHEGSVRHAFNTSVPTFQISEFSDDEDERKPYQGSSQSTKKAVPPSIFWERDDDDILFSKVSDEFLDTLEIEGYMPQKEALHELRNEADVVRAADLYLVHPVNIAIEAWRKKHSGKEIVCFAEVSSGKTRRDLQWAYKVDKKTIAVLEFKRGRMFSANKAEFDAAKVTKEEMADEKTKKQKTRQAWRQKQRTLFGKRNQSAMNLSRQVIKYYEQAETPYICHFDYETMICWDYSTVAHKERYEDRNNVTYPHAIWFQEEEQKDRTKNFRKLLLAFLVRAMEHTRLPQYLTRAKFAKPLWVSRLC